MFENWMLRELVEYLHATLKTKTRIEKITKLSAS
jgi:hypothetical protein